MMERDGQLVDGIADLVIETHHEVILIDYNFLRRFSTNAMESKNIQCTTAIIYRYFATRISWKAGACRNLFCDEGGYGLDGRYGGGNGLAEVTLLIPS